MNPSEIIDALGGTFEVARICRIKPPSVSGWKVNGIPAARLDFLRLKFPRKFRELERLVALRAERSAAGHAGRQPVSPHQILDTVPDHAVVLPLPLKSL